MLHAMNTNNIETISYYCVERNTLTCFTLSRIPTMREWHRGNFDTLTDTQVRELSQKADADIAEIRESLLADYVSEQSAEENYVVVVW